MGKGVCCAAQKAGDLGKPLIVTLHHHDPVTGAVIGAPYQRCGVCEIGASCSNPQKTVFKFRFLKGADCGLPGKCVPTAAGIAQYTQERSAAAAAGQVPEIYTYPVTPGGAITFAPHPPAGIPYTLPNP